MTISPRTKFKIQTAIKIESKFPTSQTASVLSNCHAPSQPNEESCAPSKKSGQQITPKSDRNCKEGNQNSSQGANQISKYTFAGAKADKADDDELDGEEKDRAFDGERSRRTKWSSDADAGRSSR